MKQSYCIKGFIKNKGGGVSISWLVGLLLLLLLLLLLQLALSLLVVDDDMIPLWSLGRGHSNEYRACGGS